jgi:nucleoside-diphosphate-sugar epimerase
MNSQPQNDVCVLIVGCGELGTELGRILIADGLTVAAIRRSSTTSFDGIRFFQADVTKPQTLSALSQLQPEIIVYSVAANFQTDENYRDVYVNGLRNVLDALGELSCLKHMFFISSTRVYGQHTEKFITEDTTPQPSDFGGKRIREAENLLSNLTCGTTVLRLSGIYGPTRRRMLEIAMHPNSWPLQNTWTNRIHLNDAARFIAFLIHHALDGVYLDRCYLVTDCCPASQYEVLIWLAERLGVTINDVDIPRLTGGKRLSNTKMRATGFVLKYPSYHDGYLELLKDYKA